MINSNTTHQQPGAGPNHGRVSRIQPRNPAGTTRRVHRRTVAAGRRAGLGFLLVFLAVQSGFAPDAAADDHPPSLDELLDLSPERGDGEEHQRGAGEGNVDLVPLDPGGTLLNQAVHEMRHATNRLGELTDPGPTTQRLHESIISRLDQLIEEAKKRQSGGGADSGGSGTPRNTSRTGMGQVTSGGSQPSQGQAGSGAAGGAVTGPERNGPAGTRSSWGHLPQRVRDELQQGLAEPFSPIYQRLTEAYYKTLAEQETNTE